jgi:hypothetical protein
VFQLLFCSNTYLLGSTKQKASRITGGFLLSYREANALRNAYGLQPEQDDELLDALEPEDDELLDALALADEFVPVELLLEEPGLVLEALAEALALSSVMMVTVVTGVFGVFGAVGVRNEKKPENVIVGALGMNGEKLNACALEDTNTAAAINAPWVREIRDDFFIKTPNWIMINDLKIDK